MASGRKDRYSWRDKKYSFRAVAALTLGGISTVVFAFLAVLSTALNGGVGMPAGALGTSAMLCAFAGVLLGLGSFRELLSSYAMSKAGTIISGIMGAVWFLVFCAGMM